MSESIIIAILAVVTFMLFANAKKQKRKFRQIRKRIVDRAWKRDDI